MAFEAIANPLSIEKRFYIAEDANSGNSLNFSKLVSFS